jgi:hypothetical protein
VPWRCVDEPRCGLYAKPREERDQPSGLGDRRAGEGFLDRLIERRRALSVDRRDLPEGPPIPIPNGSDLREAGILWAHAPRPKRRLPIFVNAFIERVDGNGYRCLDTL